MTSDPVALLMTSAGVVGSIRAASRCGILGFLQGGAATTDAIAAECSLDPGATALVVDALVAIGILVRVGERVALSPFASKTPLHLDIDIFDGLEDRLRGRPPRVRFDTPDGANARYADLVTSICSSIRDTAKEAASHLAAPGLEVVDIGAGAAPWSLAIVERASGCRVTAVDRPAVLEATRTSVRAAGHDACFRYRPADILEDELGSEAFDLALLGNVCHLFGEDANRALLARAWRALRPGGRLAIFEPARSADDGRFLAMYHLSLLLRTASGAVHALDAYREWLAATGFTDVEVRPLRGPISLALIEAHRPAT